ncbi:esterase-like activity of phytase family protein [Rhodovulum sp. DZ06]|uniref:esterase-like activity of phytase family protein n=1 Tax=Rhodovulum sp. DZ06 TaxID=3425126 RepID=UPI003D32C4E0
MTSSRPPRRPARRGGLALLAACAATLLAASCAGPGGGAAGVDGDGRAAAADLSISLHPWPPPGQRLDPGPHLELVEAVELRGRGAAYGGFSGLEIAPDGSRLAAVNDSGHLLVADLDRGPDGRLTAVRPAYWSILRDEVGGRPPRAERDMEGMAIPPGAMPGGPMLISVERTHRVTAYAAPDAPAHIRRSFIGAWPGVRPNAGIEALAMRADGAVLMIREAPLDRDTLVGWLAAAGLPAAAAPPAGTGVQAFAAAPPDAAGLEEIRFPRWGGFDITGADIDAEGRLWVVERRFSLVSAFAFALSVYPPDGPPGRRTGWGAPLRLAAFTGPEAENAEGIAVWTDPAGRTRLAVIADDNFALLQRTVLYDFAVKEPLRFPGAAPAQEKDAR